MLNESCVVHHGKIDRRWQRWVDAATDAGMSGQCGQVRFQNRPQQCQMSASLIGRLGSSTFRLSAAAVSMSLTGSRTSQHYRMVAKLGRGIQKTQWMGRVENLIGAARVRYPHRQPSQTSMGPGRE